MPNKPKSRVAIYVRVSTLDQAEEGYSLAAQEKALRHWCDDHNADVVAKYADGGKRGRTFKAEHIKQILSRRVYIGYNSYKGKYYKGSHEPIISKRQFHKAQKILREIAKPRKSSK